VFTSKAKGHHTSTIPYIKCRVKSRKYNFRIHFVHEQADNAAAAIPSGCKR